MNASPAFAQPLTSAFDEEAARADLYGLLAQLFYTPPAPALLAGLRAAPVAATGGLLQASWCDLVTSAQALDDATIRAEHDTLFGGIGKPEVYLFGSHYLTGFLNEKPVVKLRDDLAELGLARDPAMSETEDHIAYLYEVMRYLIVAGTDGDVPNLARQHRFYADHIQPWVHAMCDAIGAHPAARFYARLADLARAFASVEAQGFDMLG